MSSHLRGQWTLMGWTILLWIGWLLEQRTYYMHVWEGFHPCRRLCTNCYEDRTDNSVPLVVKTFPSWLWGALVLRQIKKSLVSNTSPKFCCALLLRRWTANDRGCLHIKKIPNFWVKTKYSADFQARQVLVLSSSSSRARSKSVDQDNVHCLGPSLSACTAPRLKVFLTTLFACLSAGVLDLMILSKRVPPWLSCW